MLHRTPCLLETYIDEVMKVKDLYIRQMHKDDSEQTAETFHLIYADDISLGKLRENTDIEASECRGMKVNTNTGKGHGNGRGRNHNSIEMVLGRNN